MLSKDMKEKIKLFGNVHEFLTTRRQGTDEQWEGYFKKYSDGVDYIISNDGFMVYTEGDDQIYVNDFISLGNNVGIRDEIIKLSEEKGKPITCHVYITNFQWIEVLIKRYGFKIVALQRNQYFLRRD